VRQLLLHPSESAGLYRVRQRSIGATPPRQRPGPVVAGLFEADGCFAEADPF
jgi:hypothetical protein